MAFTLSVLTNSWSCLMTYMREKVHVFFSNQISKIFMNTSYIYDTIVITHQVLNLLWLTILPFINMLRNLTMLLYEIDLIFAYIVCQWAVTPNNSAFLKTYLFSFRWYIKETQSILQKPFQETNLVLWDWTL